MKKNIFFILFLMSGFYSVRSEISCENLKGTRKVFTEKYQEILWPGNAIFDVITGHMKSIHFRGSEKCFAVKLLRLLMHKAGDNWQGTRDPYRIAYHFSDKQISALLAYCLKVRGDISFKDLSNDEQFNEINERFIVLRDRKLLKDYLKSLLENRGNETTKLSLNISNLMKEKYPELEDIANNNNRIDIISRTLESIDNFLLQLYPGLDCRETRESEIKKLYLNYKQMRSEFSDSLRRKNSTNDVAYDQLYFSNFLEKSLIADRLGLNELRDLDLEKIISKIKNDTVISKIQAKSKILHKIVNSEKHRGEACSESLLNDISNFESLISRRVEFLIKKVVPQVKFKPNLHNLEELDGLIYSLRNSRRIRELINIVRNAVVEYSYNEPNRYFVEKIILAFWWKKIRTLGQNGNDKVHFLNLFTSLHSFLGRFNHDVFAPEFNRIISNNQAVENWLSAKYNLSDYIRLKEYIGSLLNKKASKNKNGAKIKKFIEFSIKNNEDFLFFIAGSRIYDATFPPDLVHHALMVLTEQGYCMIKDCVSTCLRGFINAILFNPETRSFDTKLAKNLGLDEKIISFYKKYNSASISCIDSYQAHNDFVNLLSERLRGTGVLFRRDGKYEIISGQNNQLLALGKLFNLSDIDGSSSIEILNKLQKKLHKNGVYISFECSKEGILIKLTNMFGNKLTFKWNFRIIHSFGSVKELESKFKIRPKEVAEYIKNTLIDTGDIILISKFIKHFLAAPIEHKECYLFNMQYSVNPSLCAYVPVSHYIITILEQNHFLEEYLFSYYLLIFTHIDEHFELSVIPYEKIENSISINNGCMLAGWLSEYINSLVNFSNLEKRDSIYDFHKLREEYFQESFASNIIPEKEYKLFKSFFTKIIGGDKYIFEEFCLSIKKLLNNHSNLLIPLLKAFEQLNFCEFDKENIWKKVKRLDLLPLLNLDSKHMHEKTDFLKNLIEMGCMQVYDFTIHFINRHLNSDYDAYLLRKNLFCLLGSLVKKNYIPAFEIAMEKIAESISEKGHELNSESDFILMADLINSDYFADVLALISEFIFNKLRTVKKSNIKNIYKYFGAYFSTEHFMRSDCFGILLSSLLKREQGVLLLKNFIDNFDIGQVELDYIFISMLLLNNSRGSDFNDIFASIYSKAEAHAAILLGTKRSWVAEIIFYNLVRKGFNIENLKLIALEKASSQDLNDQKIALVLAAAFFVNYRAEDMLSVAIKAAKNCRLEEFLDPKRPIGRVVKNLTYEIIKSFFSKGNTKNDLKELPFVKGCIPRFFEIDKLFPLIFSLFYESINRFTEGDYYSFIKALFSTTDAIDQTEFDKHKFKKYTAKVLNEMAKLNNLYWDCPGEKQRVFAKFRMNMSKIGLLGMSKENKNLTKKSKKGSFASASCSSSSAEEYSYYSDSEYSYSDVSNNEASSSTYSYSASSEQN